MRCPEAARLQSWRSVHIQNSQVTDQGLEHLKALPRLKEMWISGTPITKEGIKRLQQEMPTLKTVRQ
jgi:hypothetical protein